MKKEKLHSRPRSYGVWNGVHGCWVTVKPEQVSELPDGSYEVEGFRYRVKRDDVVAHDLLDHLIATDSFWVWPGPLFVGIAGMAAVAAAVGVHTQHTQMQRTRENWEIRPPIEEPLERKVPTPQSP